MCLWNVGKTGTTDYKIFDIIVQLLFFFFLQLLILTDMAFLPVALSRSFVLSDYPDIHSHESSAGDVIFLQSIRTNPCHLRVKHMKPLGWPETTT